MRNELNYCLIFFSERNDSYHFFDVPLLPDRHSHESSVVLNMSLNLDSYVPVSVRVETSLLRVVNIESIHGFEQPHHATLDKIMILKGWRSIHPLIGFDHSILLSSELINLSYMVAHQLCLVVIRYLLTIIFVLNFLQLLFAHICIL